MEMADETILSAIFIFQAIFFSQKLVRFNQFVYF